MLDNRIEVLGDFSLNLEKFVLPLESSWFTSILHTALLGVKVVESYR